MHRIISFLKSKPVFFLLLPLFFVFHGFVENFNAIPIADASWLLLLYIVSALIIYVIAWWMYRNSLKAALLSFSIMGFHFFFGSIQDGLKNWTRDGFISRYSFLLPFFFILILVLIIYLKKRRKPIRFTYFLNLVLVVFIIIDGGWLLSKSFLKTRPGPTTQILCADCTKPDIYFLVFDEYSSSAALKELWNYDNSDLDSFLLRKGFRLLPYSRSNYNFTEFSIASTLNMDWVKIQQPGACTVNDYNKCFELIRNNKVTAMLGSAGYHVVNYSIFDIGKNPSPVSEDFLPLKTKLITSQTFLSRIRKDLYYHLLTGRFQIKWLTRDLIYKTQQNNTRIIDATLNESLKDAPSPRFVYSHIEMPHPPFYFDKAGKEKSSDSLKEEKRKPGIQPYLDYLPATNQVIMRLVNSIIDHAKKPVVIIVIGDHGFRIDQPRDYHFRNLNAVYSSAQNYSGFYEDISNINEFRILFNNLFHTDLPKIKDSTIFLKDK